MTNLQDLVTIYEFVIQTANRSLKKFDLAQIVHVRVLIHHVRKNLCSSKWIYLLFLMYDNVRFLSFVLFIFYSFVFMCYLLKT